MTERAELVKQLRSVFILDDLGINRLIIRAADALEALIRERDEARALGYREGVEKARQIYRGRGPAGMEWDWFVEADEAIRVLIPEGKAE